MKVSVGLGTTLVASTVAPFTLTPVIALFKSVPTGNCMSQEPSDISDAVAVAPPAYVNVIVCAQVLVANSATVMSPKKRFDSFMLLIVNNEFS
jgi:hypothetical protein